MFYNLFDVFFLYVPYKKGSGNDVSSILKLKRDTSSALFFSEQLRTRPASCYLLLLWFNSSLTHFTFSSFRIEGINRLSEAV